MKTATISDQSYLFKGERISQLMQQSQLGCNQPQSLIQSRKRNLLPHHHPLRCLHFLLLLFLLLLSLILFLFSHLALVFIVNGISLKVRRRVMLFPPPLAPLYPSFLASLLPSFFPPSPLHTRAVTSRHSILAHFVGLCYFAVSWLFSCAFVAF